MARMGMQSFTKNVLPFAAMVIVECNDIVMATLSKAAFNSGMSKYVYIVYHNALGIVFLLPFIILQSCRSNRPTLTFSLICRFFILGLIGIFLVQVSLYMAIDYSSPTLVAALGNLAPVFTFLLAIIFRMEKLDLRRSSSQAKSLGTIVAISGAFVMTLYKGPEILTFISSSNSPGHLLLLQQSNWILGGLLVTFNCLFNSTCIILQTAVVKVYPDEITITFFCCGFGTIQSAIFSLIVERNPGAWMLRPDIQMIATVYGAIFGSAVRYGVVTWVLGKKGPVFVAMFTPLATVIAMITGVIFLGDSFHLGSVIGAIIIALGFYSVMWGQAKERNMALDIVSGLESSPQNTPLLQK